MECATDEVLVEKLVDKHTQTPRIHVFMCVCVCVGRGGGGLRGGAIGIVQTKCRILVATDQVDYKTHYCIT